MKLKQITALTLTAAMAAGSSMAVLADDPNSGHLEGSGEVEGVVSTDVFSVVLPTVTPSDTTYKFILDPEGLIAKTENERYANAVFEPDANLFFKLKDQDADSKDQYKSTSDAQEIINKSTMDVDVTLTATVTPGKGVVMTSDKTFTDDTSTSVYLALTDGAATDPQVEAVGTNNKAVMTASIDKAADDAYEVKWNSTDNKYEYVLTDKAKAADYTGFEKFSFALTGACNTAGDWSELADAAPTVDVMWKVAKHADLSAPSIPQSSYTAAANTALEVDVNLGEGDTAATGISSITFVKPSGDQATIDSSKYTLSDGTLTLAAAWIDGQISGIGSGNSRTYTVTFNDTAKTTATFTITAP